MSGANVNFVSDGLVLNYGSIAFQTEDGGNSFYLQNFNWAGGKSSYSFGLYQYDTLGNSSARTFLSEVGFSSGEIQELEQHGGLSSSTLNSLDAQLQAALGTQAGQTDLATLQNGWVSGLTTQVTNELGSATTAIQGEIYSDPTAMERLYDISNQFSPITLASLDKYLGGQTVTPPGGRSVRIQYRGVFLKLLT